MAEIELEDFLKQHNFDVVTPNGHNYYRDTQNQSDPYFHDCGIIHQEFDSEENPKKQICEGCRGCVYSTCEVAHAFLVYLFELKWTDEQLSKYFDLNYVNLQRHRSEYPGGCHVKLNDDKECDFHKMFKKGLVYLQEILERK